MWVCANEKLRTLLTNLLSVYLWEHFLSLVFFNLAPSLEIKMIWGYVCQILEAVMEIMQVLQGICKNPEAHDKGTDINTETSY